MSAIEIQRNNVTLNAFFKYIESECKKKAMECMVDREIFENENINEDYRYYVKDGIKHYSHNGFNTKHDGKDAACQSEIYRTKPYDFQSYVKNFDGTFFNEICEFTFDDENKGSGYYYQASN